MFAVIRLRGSVKSRKKTEDTLKMLRLKRINHCVVVPKTKEYIGMLKKAKDFITYGPLNKKTLVELLKKRGKTIGDKPLNEKNLKEITKFKDFDDFADNLIKEKVKIKDFKKIKPIFRLNPPKKGFKSTRISYPKGDLGFRKDGVDKLLERMI